MFYYKKVSATWNWTEVVTSGTTNMIAVKSPTPRAQSAVTIWILDSMMTVMVKTSILIDTPSSVKRILISWPTSSWSETMVLIISDTTTHVVVSILLQSPTNDMRDDDEDSKCLSCFFLSSCKLFFLSFGLFHIFSDVIFFKNAKKIMMDVIKNQFL